MWHQFWIWATSHFKLSSNLGSLLIWWFFSSLFNTSPCNRFNFFPVFLFKLTKKCLNKNFEKSLNNIWLLFLSPFQIDLPIIILSHSYAIVVGFWFCCNIILSDSVFHLSLFSHSPFTNGGSFLSLLPCSASYFDTFLYFSHFIITNYTVQIFNPTYTTYICVVCYLLYNISSHSFVYTSSTVSITYSHHQSVCVYITYGVFYTTKHTRQFNSFWCLKTSLC